jgi:hypothetical protein
LVTLKLVHLKHLVDAVLQVKFLHADVEALVLDRVDVLQVLDVEHYQPSACLDGTDQLAQLRVGGTRLHKEVCILVNRAQRCHHGVRDAGVCALHAYVFLVLFVELVESRLVVHHDKYTGLAVIDDRLNLKSYYSLFVNTCFLLAL